MANDVTVPDLGGNEDLFALVSDAAMRRGAYWSNLMLGERYGV
jgi:hypothetical protein